MDGFRWVLLKNCWCHSNCEGWNFILTHSKSLFSVSDFFPNYFFDSFPLIVSYMQGSSTFEVCEKVYILSILSIL